MVVTPMPRATAAARSQTTSHRSAELWLAASTVAARPIAPMPAPPRPGAAVNVELRSIVRRMNWRLSSACRPKEVTAAGSPARRDILAKDSAHPDGRQRAQTTLCYKVDGLLRPQFFLGPTL